jgi:hypothetical protein
MQPMPWMAVHINDLTAYLDAIATAGPSVKAASNG